MIARPFILLLLSLLSTGAMAQQVLPLGHWRTHLPYRVGYSVAQSDEAVYFSTGQAVLKRDKSEGSIDFLTKVQGLSGTRIELIDYHRDSDILLVAYEDSSIDLVKPEGISTLLQIRNFRNFVGPKRINDIYVANDSIIYLAATYGLSKVDIRSEIFLFSTFTGIAVESVLRYDGYIYASTEEGIYRIPESEPDPEVFAFWEWMGPDFGLPGDYSAGAMAVFQETLYFEVDEGIRRLGPDGRIESVVDPQAGLEAAYLSAEGEHLLIGLRCTDTDCGLGRLLYLDTESILREAVSDCFGDPRYALEDEAGNIWFGDGFRGFRLLPGLEAEACISLDINSPWSEEVHEISIRGDQLWIAAGGVDQRFSYRFLDHGFASFINGQWRIYNRNTEPVLQGRDPQSPLLDFLSVALSPSTDKVYAGAYFEGLVEVAGEDLTLYDDSNSSLGKAVGDTARTRVSGLAFDREGVLWIANFLAERPLSTLDPDGNWRAYRPACGQTQLHQIGIDREGFKWVAVANTQAGLILFDEGDPENPSDDRCRSFNSSNSNLPTNTVNTLEVDLDGDIWVGTSEGVVIFECGANAFEDNCRGSRRIVEQDGFNAYLLATEDVRAIAVDGANRKWVGTRNGLFLISARGDEQLQHFTTANTPLLSNIITDVEVDPRSGEVFIGTDQGIISYQGDAVVGGTVHRTPLQVFPNPVRPEFQGDITIRGLARDANVKITDVNGQLVFETRALGGQAIWNGRDYSGRPVNSGVYLIFATSDPGDAFLASRPDAASGRIVVIRADR